MSKIFLFVDESGDPGYSSSNSSSTYYQLNIITSDQTGIFAMQKTLGRLRYFLNFKKELKEYWFQSALRPKIIDSIDMLLNTHDSSIRAFTFYIDTLEYTGPYLHTHSTKFRNYVLGKCVEEVFKIMNEKIFDSIELVLDRYLESRKDQEDLRLYLQGNYSLPRSADLKSKIHHIVHVQSVYCEIIQFVDIVGRYCLDVKDGTGVVYRKDLTKMKKGSVTQASA